MFSKPTIKALTGPSLQSFASNSLQQALSFVVLSPKETENSQFSMILSPCFSSDCVSPRFISHTFHWGKTGVNVRKSKEKQKWFTENGFFDTLVLIHLFRVLLTRSFCMVYSRGRYSITVSFLFCFVYTLCVYLFDTLKNAAALSGSDTDAYIVFLEKMNSCEIYL